MTGRQKLAAPPSGRFLAAEMTLSPPMGGYAETNTIVIDVQSRTMVAELPGGSKI